MYKSDVVRLLKQLVEDGAWTTNRDEIRDMVIDIMDEEDIEYYAEDCEWCAVSVQFEDEDGRDVEVTVQYELVGNNTWVVTKVF